MSEILARWRIGISYTQVYASAKSGAAVSAISEKRIAFVVSVLFVKYQNTTLSADVASTRVRFVFVFLFYLFRFCHSSLLLC